MIFESIDFSRNNNELLTIIEDNCQKASNARNEIKNAKELLSRQNETSKKSNEKKQNIVLSKLEKDQDFDKDFEEQIKYYLQDYTSLENDFTDDDFYDVLPSEKNYRYKDILLRLIAESIKEIKEYNEIMSDKEISKEDLEDIKSIVKAESRKISLIRQTLNRENIDEIKQVSSKKNKLVLVPTPGGNIRVISELKSMPQEYIPLFKELIDSIVDGTFKGVKTLKHHNDLIGISEVRKPGVRVVFKEISKKTYAIITAFIKRSSNEAGYRNTLVSKCVDFRQIQEQLKNNLENEDFINQNNFNVEELYNILNQDEKSNKNRKEIK